MSYNAELNSNNAELQEILDTINELPEVSSIPGENGATFTPSVSSDGVLSWTNDKGLENPAPVNIKGKDGTSVTVTNVSESTADGGNNVVTFSDGKTLTVKNGKNGIDGKTPVKGTDYFTAAEQTEMVNAVIAALPKYNGEVVAV